MRDAFEPTHSSLVTDLIPAGVDVQFSENSKLDDANGNREPAGYGFDTSGTVHYHTGYHSFGNRIVLFEPSAIHEHFDSDGATAGLRRREVREHAMRFGEVRGIQMYRIMVAIIIINVINWSNRSTAYEPIEQRPSDKTKQVIQKHRKVRIEPYQEHFMAKQGCRCPDGYHPVWTMLNEIDHEEYLVVDRGCGGKIKKSDVYEDSDFNELKTLNDSDKDWVLLQEAKQNSMEGNFGQVINIASEILARSPNDVTALLIRIDALSSVGLLDAALNEIGNLENLIRDHYDLSYERGVCLMMRGKYRDALNQFAITYSKTPHRHAVVYFRALCNIGLHNFDEALSDLIDIELYNDELMSNAIYSRALCHVSCTKPDFDAAIKDLEALFLGDGSMKVRSAISLAFIHSTRPDIENRNAGVALKLLEQIEKGTDFEFYIMDFAIAECVAYIENGSFEDAKLSMAKMKNMFVNESDISDSKRIEESIINQTKFVPNGTIRICK